MDDKVKKLIYQSSHRGCKETDFLLTNFAQENCINMSERELKVYEEFLSENDWDIYNWIVTNSNYEERYSFIIRGIYNNINVQKL
ncbi:Putative TPR-containing mitochondrial assembly factor-like protein [Candidatus Deianiraea vastatrix]|uniref:FAD assembly factor SdhE n=2 Tax=Candidatus Deianiraea vastatrix TaxID=2163644 RepID=A0A5B8XIP8_9RICK|nr:Putative TPR-containing mitochondrial assembly factor-like protein [Candidatus Deianiraea vastatrix]